MTRFFIAKNEISGTTIALAPEDAAHIRSLRLRPSEYFIVCDGEGTDHLCRLGEQGNAATAEIIESKPSESEPDVICSVYIAYSKGERLDYAVQKSVELGAYEIILYPSARCVAIPNDIPKKTVRLQRIALETAKQAFRGRVPEVRHIDSFKSAIGSASTAGLPVYFYESEDRVHFKHVLDRYIPEPVPGSMFTISVVTGPEGGFEPHEAEYARQKGMHTVTLGPRILRCETAPAAALAVIMYHTGNL